MRLLAQPKAQTLPDDENLLRALVHQLAANISPKLLISSPPPSRNVL